MTVQVRSVLQVNPFYLCPWTTACGSIKLHLCKLRQITFVQTKAIELKTLRFGIPYTSNILGNIYRKLVKIVSVSIKCKDQSLY